MNNVLFLNTLYRPSMYEINRNHRLQDEIEHTHIFLSYDTRTIREYNIRKARYHRLMRDRIKIVKPTQ